MSRVHARITVLTIYAGALFAGWANNGPSLHDAVLALSELKPRHRPPPSAPRQVTAPVFVPSPGGTSRDGCLPASAIRGAKVMALGAYEGGGATDLAFDGDGDAVGNITLAAEPSGDPVVLVLAGHDPIIWDFAHFPLRRLRGVIIFGYGPQGAANLPAKVPVRFAMRTHGTLDCGRAAPAYEPGGDLDKMQWTVKRHLGVGFSSFQGAYDPTAFHLEGGSLTKAVPGPLSPNNIRASAPLQTAGLHAGKRGLQQLVNAGAIRPATSADLARFGRKAGPFSSPYVVLRATTIPRDMYGANSETFLIPRGVPMPADAGSHNAYVREDGGCSGATCSSGE